MRIKYSTRKFIKIALGSTVIFGLVSYCLFGDEIEATWELRRKIEILRKTLESTLKKPESTQKKPELERSDQSGKNKMLSIPEIPQGIESEKFHKPPMIYRELTIDYSKPKHVLWPKDPNCSRFAVHFGKGISGTLLHSFPRSGNTWLRYLLEAATGIFTSSFYTDRTLIRQGYLGERVGFSQRSTIATKLHFIKHLQRYLYAPCVTVIRKPKGLLISLWSYVNIKNRRVKHTAVISENTLRTKAFHDFIPGKLAKWMRTYLFALNNRKKIFPMSYEAIKEDPIGQVRHLLHYLKIKPDEDRLTCLARHLEGKVKAGQRTVNPYTPEEEKNMEKALNVINNNLIKRGFAPLP